MRSQLLLGNAKQRRQLNVTLKSCLAKLEKLSDYISSGLTGREAVRAVFHSSDILPEPTGVNKA